MLKPVATMPGTPARRPSVLGSRRDSCRASMLVTVLCGVIGLAITMDVAVLLIGESIAHGD
jgi:hypothetical protein